MKTRRFFMFANPVENNHFQTPPPSRQEGVVLVVGMILLIMITLYALASIRGIAGQEHIAGNLYDRELAFTAAESVLRFAENLATTSASPPLKTPPTGGDKAFETADFNTLKTYVTQNPDLRPEGVSEDQAPGYAIYRMLNASGGTCDEGANTYKINAVGVGRNPASIVVLQSIVCSDK
jgi:type IV pilus assembly protein PilX